MRNYKKASKPAEKTRGYVLNPESKDGKSKAYVVKSVLGYEQADYEEFAQLIRSNLPYYRAHESHGNAYGQKYTVPMVLTGKTGRRLEVTTVWQFDNGKDFPRFITLTFKEG